MKRSATRTCVLALIATLALCACADTHSGGLRPHDSTETGNPPATEAPVIDAALVALVVSRDEVHVTGEPGAVTPGGGKVEVARLGTDEITDGDVARDGSFDVPVGGSLDDTYALRSLARSGGNTSAPVYLSRGGAAVGDQDGGVFSCEQRKDIIVEQFDRLKERVDLSCQSSADCGFIAAPGACPAWYCGVVGSRESQRALQFSIDVIGGRWCEPFAADECFNGMPLPDCAVPGPVACVEGQCMNCAEQVCPADACTTCSTPLVRWRGLSGSMSADTYELANCNTLSHSDAAASTSCSTPLPCVGSHMNNPPIWSATDVENALGDADVVAALAEDANFGALTPGGFGRNVEVGDHAIFVSSIECGSSSNCKETPEGVLALLQLLDDIAAGACTPGTGAGTLDPKCLTDFDRGDGSDTQTVYAFQKGLGTCVPKLYSGSGGNDNRFDSLDACRAACPTTVNADTACPPNRTFLPDGCLSCGPLGGCPDTAPMCAKLCSSNDDCADELGGCTTGGVCEVTGCI